MRFSNHSAAIADSDCRLTLRQLRQRCGEISMTDPVLRHITNYAVIVCSGALERAFKSIIAEYVSAGGTAAIKNYIDKTIVDSSANPKKEKICSILDRFDMGWSKAYSNALKKLSDRDCEALASLVTNRNSIAHGAQVTVDFGNVVRYYCRARNVIGALETVLS